MEGKYLPASEEGIRQDGQAGSGPDAVELGCRPMERKDLDTWLPFTLDGTTPCRPVKQTATAVIRTAPRIDALDDQELPAAHF